MGRLRVILSLLSVLVWPMVLPLQKVTLERLQGKRCQVLVVGNLEADRSRAG